MVKLVKYTAMGLMSLSMLVFVSCKDKAPEDTKEAAQDINDKNLDSHAAEKNAQYVVDAYSAGLMEIELSKFAKEKSSNIAVKDLADKMIAAHTQLDSELKGLAQQKNIALAEGLSESQMEKMNDANKKQPSEIDEFYAEKLVSDHKDAVKLYEDAADKAEDLDVKSWFASKVNEIRTHLQSAEELENKVKPKNS